MIKAYLKAIFRALATPAVKLPFVLKDIAPRKSSNIADCQPIIQWDQKAYGRDLKSFPIVHVNLS